MKRFLLEPILQTLRIRKIQAHVPIDGVMVDIGCDEPPVLINMFKNKMRKCIGIDVVAEPRRFENVFILREKLHKKISLPSQSANVITMLAVLEHLKHPMEICRECFRILKPGGTLLITVPSPQNEPLLEVLAKLQLVRPEMIEQHENYFTHKVLHRLMDRVGFSGVHVEAFELGFNTFVKAVK